MKILSFDAFPCVKCFFIMDLQIASIDLALDSYIYCTIIDISNISYDKIKIKSNLHFALLNYIIYNNYIEGKI